MKSGRRRLKACALAILVSPLVLLALPTPAQADNPPVPTVHVSTAPSALIGSDVGIDLTFENGSATHTGYGPYIDLRLPPGPNGDDGLTFTSATYLGADVANVQLTADAGGCVFHPWAVDMAGHPLHVCGMTEGQEFIALRLPFGSFTPGQPPATVHVAAHLSNRAQLGLPDPLTVTASGGFQFGATAVNDPATDPSITGATDTAGVTPTIMLVDKSYNGPESETATGPNYPRSYTLTVTVAPGQTVTNVLLSDTLPGSLQYVSTDSTTPSSSTGSTPSTNTPGGTLSRTFASITGTGGTDATMTFHYYIPRLDAGSAPVVDPSSGAFGTSIDNARADGTWQPPYSGTPIAVGAGPATHTLTDKSIAVQKSASLVTDLDASGASPGDTIQWTMSVQVSDYFALDNLKVDDLLGDGTRFDSGFTPTLAVTGNGYTLAGGSFNAANYTVSSVNGQGKTPISFRVSNQIVTRGRPNGRLVGGCINPGSGSNPPDCTTTNDGPTTVTVTFRSVIQQAYIDGKQVVEGDTLGNLTSAYGDVLDTDTFAPTGSNIGDGSAAVAVSGSGASIDIARGGLVKSIYAVNGSTSFATPVHIGPGNTVTYRLRQSFPTSRTDDFRIYDYLPLPVFHAGEMSTFDATADTTAPPAGTAKYGPSDNFHNLPGAPTPEIHTAETANSVEFRYGDFVRYPTEASLADILFTVTVSTDPFADGLLLTNQARSQTRNAAGALTTADAIIQITLDQPVLTITKGVVGTDNSSAKLSPATPGPVTFPAVTAPPSLGCPGWSGGAMTRAGLATHPIDSNVTGVDAGDLVRFAMVVQNTGHSPAFEVQVEDEIPAGFQVPSGGLDLCVYNGARTELTYTNVGGGTGLFDKGVQLDDGPHGSLAAGASGGVANAAGTNVLAITYTLQVAGTAVPGSTITNTATILDFTNDPGAESHVASPITDTASATLISPAAAKTLDATDRVHTTTPLVAVGEILTYKLTLGVPEGTLPGATVADTLPVGLSLLDCVGIAPSADVTTSLGSDFSSACHAGTNPAVNGQVVTFDLGTVTNLNRDNATPESITITYRTVVTNVATNVRGHALHNSAVLSWTGGSLPAASADDVLVEEPKLTVTKTGTASSADAGNAVDYTVVIANPTDSNGYGSPAFEVSFSDLVPLGLSYTPGSFKQTDGPEADTASDLGAPTLGATWAVLPEGASVTFTYSVTIDGAVSPSQNLDNAATVTWSGLPGNVTVAQSPFSDVSTERTGNPANPGGDVNDYMRLSTARINVPAISVAKSMTGTNQGFTTGTNVAVGEIVTYEVVLTVPEGTATGLQLTDTLPAGMALVGCDSVTPSATGLSGLNTTLAGGFGDACDAGTNPTVVGQNVVFDLGTVENRNRNDLVAETITVQYRAVVLNASTNARGRQLQNSAQATWSAGDSNTSTSPQITVVEPHLIVTKSSNATATTDASDTITYDVKVDNATDANGTTAFEIAWTDSVPVGLHYQPGSLRTKVGSCSVAPATTNDSGAPTLTATWTSLADGESCTLQYDVVVDDHAPSGSSYQNTASATYTSLSGSVTTPQSTFSSASTERTGNQLDPGTPTGEVNNYAATGQTTVTLAQPAPVKSVVLTSEAGTAGAFVTIGEVVRYRIVAKIPEGVSASVTVQDNLPAGLIYLPGNNTKVAFVCDGGLTSDAFSGAGLQMASVASPTFVLPSGQITPGTFSDGTDPTFALGTLTNLDSDAGDESVVIEFNAVVENIAGNHRSPAVNLDNTASLFRNGTLIDTSLASAALVTIAEPSVTFGKTVTTTPTDGGDTIVYRISISNLNNASVSPAYDLHVTDTINSNVTVSGIVVAGAGLTWTDNSSVATNSVDVAFDPIPLNKSATITITGTVSGTVDAGTSFSSTAGATWSTLPGLKGTTGNSTGSDTPGDPGTTTGERTYSGSSGPTTTLAVPSISKLGPTPTTTAVGDTTTFDLVVTLPEGTTRGLIVVDTIPVNMIADSYSVVTLAASSDLRLTADYNGVLATPTSSPPSGSVGGAWTLNFGDTVTTADNVAANNKFLVRITGRVANVVANQKNTDLTNSASVKYTKPQSGQQTVNAPSTRFVTVIEPALSLTKTRDTGSPRFGQTVTYTLTLNHSAASNAHAYDVSLTDSLPAGLTYVASSLQKTAGPTPTSIDDTGGNITITFGTFASGSTATFTYQAVVADSSSVSLGQGLTNVARVTWTSTAGSNANERTGADGSGGALNDYATSASAILTVSGIDLNIADDDGQTQATAGSTRVFALGYQNTGNQTAIGVTISTTVPTGTAFNSASSTAGWSCANGAAAGTVCTHAVGAVDPSPTVNGSFNFAVIVVDPIAAGLTQIRDTATITDDHSQNVDPTPADNTASDTDAIPQADLSLTKGVDIARPGANQTVVFTITLANDGPDQATNVRVADLIPSDLTFVSADASQGSYVSGTGVWTVGSVDDHAAATLHIHAQVTKSKGVTNAAEVTRSDQGDPDSTPANGVPSEDDYATAALNPTVADLAVTKDIDNPHPDPGTNVTFTIVATNNGPDDATGVHVTDALPGGTTLVSATTLTGDWSGGTWTIGDLAHGATASLTVVASVDSAGPQTNTATIAGDPFDSNPANDSDSASIDQLVNLVVDKSAGDPTPNVGSIVTFTVKVTNEGPNAAHGVVIHDAAPTGLTFVGNTGQGSYSDTTSNWTAGTIAAGDSATLQIQALVVGSDAMTNLASVSHVDEPQSSTSDDSDTATVTPPHADLAVAKTVTEVRPDVGDDDSFTIKVTNNGPADATGVAVTDAPPTGLSYASATGSQGSYDPDTHIWTVGAIANGASATLTLGIHVDASDDFTNTAKISASDQYDPDPSNDSASASLSTRVADIAIVKNPSSTTPSVGTNVTFTITATNGGPDRASQLVVHDALPAGLTWVSSSAGQGSYDAASGDWTVGVLADGDTATLTVTARVVGSGSIHNTAAVSHLLQRDPVARNDSDTADLDVPPAADLSLTKGVDVDTPDKGTNVTFTVTVTNHGPNGASGIVVHDALPEGVTYISDAPGQGTYDTGSGNWTIGSLSVGDHATLAVTVSVDVEGPIVNVAEITDSSLPDPDSTPGNGATGEDDRDTASLNARGLADLSLTNVADVTRVTIGKQFTYTLIVTNAGPDRATGVVVRDQLPKSLVFVGTSGAYNATTGAWTVGSLAVGDSATLTITVRVGQAGSIASTAEVVSESQRDPNSTPDNNVPSEDDQDTAQVQGAQATPPPTGTGDRRPAPVGSMALVFGLLALAIAGFFLVAASRRYAPEKARRRPRGWPHRG